MVPLMHEIPPRTCPIPFEHDVPRQSEVMVIITNCFQGLSVIHVHYCTVGKISIGALQFSIQIIPFFIIPLKIAVCYILNPNISSTSCRGSWPHNNHWRVLKISLQIHCLHVLSSLRGPVFHRDFCLHRYLHLILNIKKACLKGVTIRKKSKIWQSTGVPDNLRGDNLDWKALNLGVKDLNMIFS